MVRFAVAGLLIAGAGSAHAATIVIFFSPITLDRHTAVYDTPGPDRLLMCMEPPGTAGCTELPMKKRR
jgi:hypothetical protein